MDITMNIFQRFKEIDITTYWVYYAGRITGVKFKHIDTTKLILNFQTPKRIGELTDTKKIIEQLIIKAVLNLHSHE